MSVLAMRPASLTLEQQKTLDELVRSLQPGQAMWLSGYFSGLARGIGEASDAASIGLASHVLESAATGTAARSLTILYGSETGNSAALAKSLAGAASERGLKPVVVDMADYKPRKLKDEQDLLIVTSTHGEGDPPQSATGFFEFLEGRKAPRLPDTRYAILALGDSTYEHYCEAGKRLDRRLAELGAARLAPRVDCDVDYDEPAAAWIASVIAEVAPDPSQAAGTGTLRSSQSDPISGILPSSVPAFDKHRPFGATVIDNIALTGRGSSKQTRHIELSLAGSGLAYEPGDALGVKPRNDPALVDAILDCLSLSAEAAIQVKDRNTTLGEALSADFEISAVTPRFIDRWAEISGAAELAALRGEEQAESRALFMRGHHIIDLLRRFPAKGVEPQAFLSGLRSLQPRLYSIASSQAAAPDEVHLTVTRLTYDLHGEPRVGVASGQLADRAAPDTVLPVYIQSNPHFRLAEDDVPIIMIGAGTGVAPYRAFLQEREVRGAQGKSWLFFGERNFRSDFLYQTEWQGFLKDGVLSRMNVAFSRDQAAKTYVQHRLKEQARDVYAWLQDGAHLYVCGDAANLAPDVHKTLIEIVQQEAGIGRTSAEDYLGTLQGEHRYQIDVY
jgi:sulfite reductase (NADPH) flavoprotein alpha-component